MLDLSKYKDLEVKHLATCINYKMGEDKPSVDFSTGLDILNNYFSDKESEWLVYKELLNAPATLNDPGNYKGGLFLRSLITGMELLEGTNELSLRWDNENSPMRIGILCGLHCVDDFYFRFKPVLKDGVYCREFEIQENPYKLYTGTGIKSILLIGDNISLTDEEKNCIIYYRSDSFSNENVTNMVRKYPNISYTSSAFNIATKSKGV